MFSSILIGFILGRYEGFIVNYGKQKNVDRLSQLINYLDKEHFPKVLSSVFCSCCIFNTLGEE